jgi:hypothetical protein
VPGHSEYIQANDRERERLRAVVGRLSEDGLRAAVNEQWTVSGVLAAPTMTMHGRLKRSCTYAPCTGDPPRYVRRCRRGQREERWDAESRST